MGELRITSELLWRGTRLLALLDLVLVPLVLRAVGAGRFRAMGRSVLTITGLAWLGLWIWVVTAYWDAVYAHLFPAGLRWYLPAIQALLTTAYAAAALAIARRVRRHPVLAYLLLGGAWGVGTHAWALTRGLVTRPPPLIGASPAAVLAVAFFEFLFYWCLIVLAASVVQGRGWSLPVWSTRRGRAR